MTIAAAFYCSDGIVFASDTLYSFTGTGPKYGPKFWLFDHGDVVVSFGGAGTEVGLVRVRDEVARKLKPGLSEIRIVDAIDDALAKVSAKLGDPLLRTQVLVGIRTAARTALFQNDGLNLLSEVQQPCQCVGSGAPLGWYFAHSLFRPGMSMRWASVVAAHMVRKAKDYVEGCGGDTHIYRLPTSGTPEHVVDPAATAALERHLAELEAALNAVLPDDRANDDTLERRREILVETLEKVRRSFYLKAEPGSFEISTGMGVSAEVVNLSGD